MLNVPLTTILVTHGAALLLLLWYLTPPEALGPTVNQDHGPGHTHAPADFSKIIFFSSELGLTTREGEVLSWLSKGKTNRDIAQILGLSPRTVDKHLEQIYSKLGVENRTAAAAIAVNAKNRKT